MCKGSPGAQKHATCALWGVAQDPRYQITIVSTDGAIERLVELLRDFEGETQGFAAATLVCLAHNERGKESMIRVGGTGPLMSIAYGPANWLRSQCVDVLKLLGYPDPTDQPRSAGSPLTSPRLVRYQAELVSNPAVWMYTDEPLKQHLNDEHMADLARKLKAGDRVIVEAIGEKGERKGEVRYVGKIPEIAPGYWIGVHYDEADGKNDGSIKSNGKDIRMFQCVQGFGGFLRPNHFRVDPDPPARKARTEIEVEVQRKKQSVAESAPTESVLGGRNSIPTNE
jgi:hypothetical protein